METMSDEMYLPHFMSAEGDAGNLLEVSLLEALVAIDSTDPGAYETQISEAVYTWLAEEVAMLPASLGSHVTLISREVLPDRRNILARIEGSTDASPLVLSCHMDTVPVGAGWTYDPLSLTADDRMLYGRGSCDMKGGLSCALAAFSNALSDMRRKSQRPQRSLALLLSVDEEDQMRGIETAIQDGWVGERDWLLDLEPTDGKVRTAHKGRLWIEVTITGASAHASTPWEGCDAVAAAAEVIGSMRRAVAALPADPFLGNATITFGQIRGGEHPYIVPRSCTVWMDIRLVPPASSHSLCNLLDEAIERAEQSVPGAKGSYRVTGDRPSVHADPMSPLLEALLRATEQVVGERAAIDVFTGYTDTAVVAVRTGNPHCLSYGPGSLSMAHKPNEFVPFSDLQRVRRVLQELLDEVLWQ